MIYFLRNSEGSIKIGSTSNLTQRLSTLQTGNSGRLELLYIIEMPDDKSRSFESLIHGICKKYRIRGEWFKPEVLNHLFEIDWYKENMLPVSQFK